MNAAVQGRHAAWPDDEKRAGGQSGAIFASFAK
jgi:hypothetical protein